MQTPGLCYLASPYSSPNPLQRIERFEAACSAAATLMLEGYLIFSPIAHTHPIAERGNLPTGWDFWRDYDLLHLEACTSMLVLMLPGWRKSVGVQDEIAIMERMGKSVRYMRWPWDWKFYRSPDAAPFVEVGR